MSNQAHLGQCSTLKHSNCQRVLLLKCSLPGPGCWLVDQTGLRLDDNVAFHFQRIVTSPVSIENSSSGKQKTGFDTPPYVHQNCQFGNGFLTVAKRQLVLIS